MLALNTKAVKSYPAFLYIVWPVADEVLIRWEDSVSVFLYLGMSTRKLLTALVFNASVFEFVRVCLSALG